MWGINRIFEDAKSLIFIKINENMHEKFEISHYLRLSSRNVLLAHNIKTI